MAEKKYSHISLETSEGPEEVFRVTAEGITRETFNDAQAFQEEIPSEKVVAESETLTADEAEFQDGPEKSVDEPAHNTADYEPEEVPYANMQRAIFCILAAGLLAFIIYFVMTH